MNWNFVWQVRSKLRSEITILKCQCKIRMYSEQVYVNFDFISTFRPAEVYSETRQQNGQYLGTHTYSSEIRTYCGQHKNILIIIYFLQFIQQNFISEDLPTQKVRSWRPTDFYSPCISVSSDYLRPLSL